MLLWIPAPFLVAPAPLVGPGLVAGVLPRLGGLGVEEMRRAAFLLIRRIISLVSSIALSSRVSWFTRSWVAEAVSLGMVSGAFFSFSPRPLSGASIRCRKPE